MNLNYEKIKQKIEHGGNPWTSYSDLFLVLSVIFLLLYVVSNLRSGASSVINAKVYQQTLRENETLKQQIKGFEVLKDDYLQKGASDQEVAMYQQLVQRLDLLGEQSKEERAQLEQQAKDLQEKENALNSYQMLMKGIINANMIAQAKMKHRDQKIEEKDKTIQEKDKSISDLGSVIAQKQNEITKSNQQILQNNGKIAQIQAQLAKQINEVKYANRSKKRSQEAMQAEIQKLQKNSQQAISLLRDKNTQFVSQLQKTHKDMEDKNRELERLINTLNEKENGYKGTIAKLQADYEANKNREHAAFEKEILANKMSAEAKIKKQREYLARAEAEKSEYDNKLNRMKAELEGTQKNIHEMANKYQGSIASLSQTNQTLQANLKNSIAKQNERKILAQRIKDNLKRAGVNAEVDAATGDVTINFLNEYFETGKADLKSGMKTQLEKFFPYYSAALFEDHRIVQKIASVDIIGFASPTFQNRLVDPESLNPGDRVAVNFNMDLSFQRAKSIFEYVFDTRKMVYKHQKDLLPIVHVSGRSYLAEKINRKNRMPASTTAQDYCLMYDCKKSQKVIIKFNLRED